MRDIFCKTLYEQNLQSIRNLTISQNETLHPITNVQNSKIIQFKRKMFVSFHRLWISCWSLKKPLTMQRIERLRSVFSFPRVLISSTLVVEYASASTVKTGLLTDYYSYTCSKYYCIY